MSAPMKATTEVRQFNVGADDVSEEYVDLTARVANGHRLEDRLVELLTQVRDGPRRKGLEQLMAEA